MVSLDTPSAATSPFKGIRLSHRTRHRPRHRARIMWRPYRPAHMDDSQVRIARILPSWTYLTHWTTTTNSRPPEPSAPAVVAAPSIPPVPESAPPENMRSPSHTDSRRKIDRLAGPQAPRPTMLVDDEYVSGGSPLASLLGFGVDESHFNHPVTRYSAQPSSKEGYWSRLPSLKSVSTDAEDRRSVGDAVQAMWDATETWEMDADILAQGPSDAGYLTKRSIWRVVGIVALVGLVAAGGYGAYQYTNEAQARNAAERQAEYEQSARELLSALGPVAQSVYSDGLTTEAGISELTVQLGALDIAARRSALIAGESLPGTPIPGRASEVAMLLPAREALAHNSDRTLDIGQGISDAMAYVIAMQRAFALPDLPTQASQDQADSIGLQLSTSLAEGGLVITELPDTPGLESFRHRAADTLLLVEDLQGEYMTALRKDDQARAAAASREIQESVAALHRELEVPLQEMKIWAVTGLEEVASGLATIST